MKRMVVGFAFTEDIMNVLLIHKRRGPAVVFNRMNGIGGQVEEGETALQAQVREFEEEAGVHIPEPRWVQTVILSGPHDGGWEVTFFYCHLTVEECQKCHTTTDEPIEWVGTHTFQTKNVVPNLRWLIPMQHDRIQWPLKIEEIDE